MTETRLHIADVSDRVRAAAPEDLREELLRVTAFHEDRDDPPLAGFRSEFAEWGAGCA